MSYDNGSGMPSVPDVETNASSSSYAGSGSSSSSSSSSASSGSTPRTQSSSSSSGGTTTSPSRSSGDIGLIATMSVVGSVMLIVIAFLAFKYIQKKRQKNEHPETVLPSTERSGEDFSRETTKIFTPRELKEFTNNYKVTLGSGGFGDVFKGMLPDGRPVAVKVLKKAEDEIDQFKAELFTIGKTQHVNLVELYGFCFNKDTKALVYEYMVNGSLQSCLDNKDIKLELRKLHQIAVGTARGIRYLHEECPKIIIHYDIKPANVLLDEDYIPKVADFGMAGILNRETAILAVTQGRGTRHFAAPELFSFTSTVKCDVYSFGMLLFHILWSRRDMEVEHPADWIEEKAKQGELESILSSCETEENDRVLAERMCKVALMCVEYEHAKRPRMSEVLRMLEGEQEIVKS